MATWPWKKKQPEKTYSLAPKPEPVSPSLPAQRRISSEPRITELIPNEEPLEALVWVQDNPNAKMHALMVRAYDFSQLFIGKQITSQLEAKGSCPTSKTRDWTGHIIKAPKGNLCAHCSKLPTATRAMRSR